MADKEKNGKESRLTRFQKIVIAIVALLSLSSIILIGVNLFGEDKSEIQDNPSLEETTEKKVDNNQKTDVDEEENDEKDDRPTLEQNSIEQLEAQAIEYAQKGQWDKITSLLENTDWEYNLNASEDSEYLRDLFLDANVLYRLTEMGDTAEAVMSAVDMLPGLKTPEMFVWGLYYLPRNVILEMSADSLALAPTHRGNVVLTERIDLPNTNPDGYKNDELDKHDVIQRYFNMPRLSEFEQGFYRFNVLNGEINEYVYIVIEADEEFSLIGFYSDDDNPANTTQTVEHYKSFGKEVEKGLEQRLKDAQENYEESLNE